MLIGKQVITDNERINADWSIRFAIEPADYARRYAQRADAADSFPFRRLRSGPS